MTQVLCIGRIRSLAVNLEAKLAPVVTFPAIMDSESYSSANLHALLSTLNPRPAGVFVGGGVSSETQEEIRDIVQKWNDASKASEPKLEFMCIPPTEASQREAKVKEVFGERFGSKW